VSRTAARAPLRRERALCGGERRLLPGATLSLRLGATIERRRRGSFLTAEGDDGSPAGQCEARPDHGRGGRLTPCLRLDLCTQTTDREIREFDSRRKERRSGRWEQPAEGPRLRAERRRKMGVALRSLLLCSLWLLVRGK